MAQVHKNLACVKKKLQGWRAWWGSMNFSFDVGRNFGVSGVGDVGP